jgi:hypothetical protein
MLKGDSTFQHLALDRAGVRGPTAPAAPPRVDTEKPAARPGPAGFSRVWVTPRSGNRLTCGITFQPYLAVSATSRG